MKNPKEDEEYDLNEKDNLNFIRAVHCTMSRKAIAEKRMGTIG